MPSTSTHASTPHARERGWTLVEMIVAGTIVAILMAIVIPRFVGAKGSTYAKEARSAGAAYAQAISSYQADNFNKNPSWPTSKAEMPRGPKNLVNKYYLAQVPDGITAGRIGLSVNDGNCSGTKVAGAAAQYGWVSICVAGAGPDFGVRVASRTDTSSNQWDVCWLGRTAKSPHC